MGSRWTAIRRGRGDLPPVLDGLVMIATLQSPSTSIVSSAVATLGDDSGLGNNLTQAVGVSRASYTAVDAAFGGRPSMTSNGTNNGLGINSFGAGFTGITWAIPWRLNANQATTRHVLRHGDYTTTNGAYVCGFSPSSLDCQHYYTSNHAGLQTIKANTTTVSAVNRQIFAVDPTTSGTGCVPYTYVNGVSVGSYTSSSAAVVGSFQGMELGFLASVAAGGGNSCPMTTPGVFCWKRVLPTSEVAQVDDWMKWNWSL